MPSLTLVTADEMLDGFEMKFYHLHSVSLKMTSGFRVCLVHGIIGQRRSGRDDLACLGWYRSA